MRKRNLFMMVALGIFLLAGIIGAGFAYWAGSVEGTDKTEPGNTITIGEGQTVYTHVTIGAINNGASKTLVPATRAEHEDDVEEIIFTFSIVWKENGTTGTPANPKDNMTDGDKPTRALQAVIQNILIDGFDTNASLVNTTVQIGGNSWGDNENLDITLDGSEVKVFVKVTLTEPGTKAIYEAIANKNITFDVKFTVPAA